MKFKHLFFFLALGTFTAVSSGTNTNTTLDDFCQNVTNSGQLNPWFDLNQPGPTYDPPNISANAASGGSGGGIVYQWEKREGSGNWVEISGATGNGYNSPTINTTTSFRRKARRCGNPWLFSNIITITLGSSNPSCDNITNAGSLTYSGNTSPSGNSFDPPQISGNAASGGTGGSIVYRWQEQEVGGSWSTISGATGQNYDPGTITTSTNYRRQARRDCQNNWINSNTISISLSSPPPTGGSTEVTVRAKLSGTCCANIEVQGMTNTNFTGSNPVVDSEALSLSNTGFQEFTVTLDGTFPANQIRVAYTNDADGRDVVIRWMKVGGVEYFSSDPDTYSVGVWLNGSCDGGFKEQQRLACNGYFHYATSGAPDPDPGNCDNVTNAGTLTYNGNTNPTGSSFDPPQISGNAASGGTGGTIQYRWQSQSGGGSWSTISGATGQNYNPGIINSTTSYRRQARRDCQSNWITSNTISITLSSNPGGGQTSAVTWNRFAGMGKGLNLSGWLEAHWFIQNKAYPATYNGANDFPLNEYNEQDIANAKAQGFESIRLPVTFEHFMQLNPPYTVDFSHPVFDRVDDVIQWAQTYDMTLIIDNHHGPKNPPRRLTNANYQNETPRLQALWSQLIDRYGNLDPNRYFFELYNEPDVNISNDNWRSVAVAMVNTIRSKGSNHTLIVGPAWWNGVSDNLNDPQERGLHYFDKLADNNIIYTFHFYHPFNYTHQQFPWSGPPCLPSKTFTPGSSDAQFVASALGVANTWAQNGGDPVPLMVGEFGDSQMAPSSSRCNWISTVAGLFNQYNFAWYYWGPTSYDPNPVNSCVAGLDQDERGFGFYTNGNYSSNSVISCFAQALGLAPFNSLVAADVPYVAPSPTTNPFLGNGVKVYPNPFTNELNVSISLQEEADVIIDLIDHLGRVMQTTLQEEKLPRGSHQLRLPTVGIAPGVYYAKVRTNEKTTWVKLIHQ